MLPLLRSACPTLLSYCGDGDDDGGNVDRDDDAADGNADEQMMVPGYGEELEMGFNATSQCNCKPNPHKYNGKLATGHNRAHWCGPLHFAQYNANGPQLICTHFVEKEFC